MPTPAGVEIMAEGNSRPLKLELKPEIEAGLLAQARAEPLAESVS